MKNKPDGAVGGIFVFAGICLMLIGGSLGEVLFTSEDARLLHYLSGVFFSAPFLILGILLIIGGLRDLILSIKGRDKAISKALKQAEAPVPTNPLKSLLVDFRNHYSQFFDSLHTSENEKIQWEATQIYRNILEFRKARLRKLGITFHIIARSMQYKRPGGISTRSFSDGKYDITEVEEEIAAETVYEKDGRKIYSHMDKELACYTITHAKQVGDSTVICPNCGAETTRENLLDGCDYCSTKFLIEDLGDRVAEFAFRPDYETAYAKYKKRRNQLFTAVILVLCALAFVVISVYLVTSAPDWIPEGTGIILSITSVLLGSILSAVLFIPLILIAYWWIIPLSSALVGTLNLISKIVLKKLKDAPVKDKSFVTTIQKYDPNFSISSFYSALQNKLSSIIYADNEKQIHAFAEGDLSPLLGPYKNVIDMDVEYMGITSYSVGPEDQLASVDVFVNLTEYDGSKCRNRREGFRIDLAKSAQCKTQVVCGPAVMTCKSCGGSIDLLKGKECIYCGHKLEMKDYDWVITKIESIELK